jgi:adenylate cyclase
MEACAKTEINEWIVRAALAGIDEIEIVAGVCQRLNRAGVALVRSSVAINLLDPTIGGRAVRWNRGEGALEEAFPRTDDAASEDWVRSPFFFLIESGQPSLRRRLDATYRAGEFPMLDGFRAQGVTDYLAFAERVGDSVLLGEGEGMVASWTTDAPAGFSDAQVEMLAGIMPALTLAFMLRTTNRAARALITTYLGSDAAERVLAGNIVRGRAIPIRAVVWFSDLIGFARLSDTLSPDVLLAPLNDYAEAQVEEIEAHGGHVLKFMGDGILAIFPDDDTTRACKRALDAPTCVAGLRC